MESESDKLYNTYVIKSKQYAKEYIETLNKIKKHDEFKKIQKNIEELTNLLYLEKKRKRLFSKTKTSELIGYMKSEVEQAYKDFQIAQESEISKAKRRADING